MIRVVMRVGSVRIEKVAPNFAAIMSWLWLPAAIVCIHCSDGFQSSPDYLRGTENEVIKENFLLNCCIQLDRILGRTTKALLNWAIHRGQPLQSRVRESSC